MPKKRPLIGVTTSANKGHLMWWFIRLGVYIAGGKAKRVSTRHGHNYTDCDAYIISGGIDIDPSIYGQENIASLNIDHGRDLLEKEVITHALESNKAIMGICRGAQMINVTKGGDLHQNARDIYADFIPTTSIIGKIFGRRLVKITKEGVLLRLFADSPTLSVNSIHHQAIAKLGKDLEIVAEDRHGIPQAIEGTNSKDPFILAMQWHPEFMLHSKSHRKLFKLLVVQAG